MDAPMIESVIGELTKGRELAKKLQIMVQNDYREDGSVSVDEIVVKILRSFNETLSVVSSWDSGEVSQIPAMIQVGSPSSGDRRSEYSGESSKRPALKDRRGSYKRRRTSKSWIVVSPTTEDSYAWRKYGQKEILNCKQPRCYYRCTHKPDQGCKATKQLQKMEDNSNLYQITYFGQHTCRDLLMPPQVISNTHHPVDSYVLNFESKFQSFNQDHPSLLLKQEPKEETQSEGLSSLDSIVWPDLMALESQGPTKFGSDDHEDVISSTVLSCGSNGSHGLDMDFLDGSVDFDNVFHFDEISELF